MSSDDSDALVAIIGSLSNITNPTTLETIRNIIENRIRRYSSGGGGGGGGASKAPVRKFATSSRVRGGAFAEKPHMRHRASRAYKPDSEKGCIHGDMCRRRDNPDNPCPYNHDIAFETNRSCRNGRRCNNSNCKFVHPAGWTPAPFRGRDGDEDAYEEDSSDGDDFTVKSSAPAVPEDVPEADTSSADAVPAVPDDDGLKMKIDEHGGVNWGE